MLKSKIFSLLTIVLQSFLKRQDPISLKDILLKKLSMEAKNLPYLVLGIFLFAVTFSIGLFSFVFGTVTYYQSAEFTYFLNSWIITSLVLFSIAGLILIPIVNYINLKSKEIETINTIKKPVDNLLLEPLRPLLNELRREQQNFVNAWTNPNREMRVKAKKYTNV